MNAAATSRTRGLRTPLGTAAVLSMLLAGFL